MADSGPSEALAFVDAMKLSQTGAEMQTAALAPEKAQADISKLQADTAEAQARSQLTEAQVGGQEAASQLAQYRLPYEKALVQDAQISLAINRLQQDDPNLAEHYKETLQRLVDQGNTDAQQWLDQGYSPGAFGRLKAAYPSELEAVGGKTRGTPSAGAGGADGSTVDPSVMQLQLAGMTPQQLQGAATQLGKFTTALQAVQNSSNPSAEFDRQARLLGHPEWVGQFAVKQPDGRTMFEDLQGQINGWNSAMESRNLQTSLGLPAPVVPREVKEAAGGIWSIDPLGRDAKLLGGGTMTPLGTDAQGRVLMYNQATRTVTPVGPPNIGPRPGTMGLGGAPGGKPKTEETLETEAHNEALANARFQQGQADSGEALPPNPQSIATDEASILARKQAAQDGEFPGWRTGQWRPGRVAGGGGPAAAPARPTWAGLGRATPQQAQTWQQKQQAGAKTSDGSIAAPYVVPNNDVLQRLPQWSRFIAPDGSVRRKTWASPGQRPVPDPEARAAARPQTRPYQAQ